MLDLRSVEGADNVLFLRLESIIVVAKGDREGQIRIFTENAFSSCSLILEGEAAALVLKWLETRSPSWPNTDPGSKVMSPC